jgi:hypothetical protein
MQTWRWLASHPGGFPPAAGTVPASVSCAVVNAEIGAMSRTRSALLERPPHHQIAGDPTTGDWAFEC